MSGDQRVPDSTTVPSMPYLGNPAPGVPTLFDQARFGKQQMYEDVTAGPATAATSLLVPTIQMPTAAMQKPQGFSRLTPAQQSELEMARRRAQKAAEGKRANATAARRAKRRMKAEQGADKDDSEAGGGQGDSQEEDEVEAKLAVVEDAKEAKRLKRLLRNRVSAQQARERKKSYVQDLEGRSKVNEQKCAQLEQRVKTLERENVMLRSVIKNMQGGGTLDNGLEQGL